MFWKTSDPDHRLAKSFSPCPWTCVPHGFVFFSLWRPKRCEVPKFDADFPQLHVETTTMKNNGRSTKPSKMLQQIWFCATYNTKWFGQIINEINKTLLIMDQTLVHMKTSPYLFTPTSMCRTHFRFAGPSCRVSCQPGLRAQGASAWNGSCLVRRMKPSICWPIFQIMSYKRGRWINEW